VYVFGEEQETQEPPSSLHSNVQLDSLQINENVAVDELVITGG
jgi:hypothetical protein